MNQPRLLVRQVACAGIIDETASVGLTCCKHKREREREREKDKDKEWDATRDKSAGKRERKQNDREPYGREKSVD